MNKAINPVWLKSMSAKRELLRNMFAVFLAEEPARMDKIRSALKSGRTKELKFLAHSLKGSAATLNAERLKACCQRLENATKIEDIDQALVCFSDLETEIEAVYAVMLNYLENN
ncbi:MAG: Hpt domain-containing protein [Desulfovibrionaceae bacterium]|nr:Hpt domain-containing protein [Desulfovibrionaceae bacterium]